MCLEKNVVGGEIVVATVEGMGGGMGREVWGSMGLWGGDMGAGYAVPNWFDTRRISVDGVRSTFACMEFALLFGLCLTCVVRWIVLWVAL